MDQAPTLPPPPPTGVEYCYRHPGVETGVHCTRCNRPICTDCMIPAPVGHQCPECAARAGREVSAPIRHPQVGTRGGAPFTTALLIVLIAVYGAEVAVAGGGSIIEGPGGLSLVKMGASLGLAAIRGQGLVGIAAGEPWRLATAMFLHASILHIAFNGYALYLFGSVVEREMGRVRFATIYLVTGLCASVASYAWGDPLVPSVGASGAIFGLFGAFVAYNYRRRELAFYAARMRSAVTLIVINMVFTFTFPGIDWRAHVGGLVTGLAVGYAADQGDQRTRTLALVGTVIALLVAAAAITMWRTDQLRTLAGLS
jgi:membrane associated rhomboid family serine protease